MSSFINIKLITFMISLACGAFTNFFNNNFISHSFISLFAIIIYSFIFTISFIALRFTITDNIIIRFNFTFLVAHKIKPQPQITNVATLMQCEDDARHKYLNHESKSSGSELLDHCSRISI